VCFYLVLLYIRLRAKLAVCIASAIKYIHTGAHAMFSQYKMHSVTHCSYHEKIMHNTFSVLLQH